MNIRRIWPYLNCCSWRVGIGTAVVLLSLLLGLTNLRVFPFSNYPMFAVTYIKPQIYTVEFVDENGLSQSIDNHFLYPMSRLYLNESIKVALIKGQSPLHEISWILKRIKNNNNSNLKKIKSVRVVKYLLNVNPQAESPYEIQNKEIIDEVAI